MAHRFKKHYTRDEARVLLPAIRQWLERMNQLRSQLEQNERRVAGSRPAGGDLGGELPNQSVRVVADLKDMLRKFESREIFIKDLARGLIDFPAIIGGREVFLCWEMDEEDIEFWHDIDSGYAGRERL
jgi:hypothetical protein